MGCKNLCERNVVPFGYSTFLKSKRCNLCATWYSPDKRVCPCCGLILRSKPRNKKETKKITYQQKLEIQPWIVAK